MTRLPVETIAQQARIPLAVSSSTKAALDCDWSVPEQRSEALVALVDQRSALHDWLDRVDLTDNDIIAPYIEAVEQVLTQNAEDVANFDLGAGHCRRRLDNIGNFTDPRRTKTVSNRLTIRRRCGDKRQYDDRCRGDDSRNMGGARRGTRRDVGGGRAWLHDVF